MLVDIEDESDLSIEEKRYTAGDWGKDQRRDRKHNSSCADRDILESGVYKNAALRIVILLILRVEQTENRTADTSMQTKKRWKLDSQSLTNFFKSRWCR